MIQENMLQEVMTAPGEIRFDFVPVPEPGRGEVLVKIRRIGVCGSDIHVWHGTHPYTAYPVTQGHEVSGSIAKIGADVSGLEIGQKVTIEPQVTCGTCYSCRHGRYNLCENLKVMGFQTTGCASEYFAVPVSKVTPLPEFMSYDQGAMLEPLAVTVAAAKKYPSLRGAKAAVIGCGPIGILLAQTLKAFGAEKVLITDIFDSRLELARTCGIDAAVNTKKVDFQEALLREFGPDKADVIFDCAGNDISIGQAIRDARKGSMIVLVAVFGKLAKVDLAKLNDSELDLNTSMMYRHEDYVDAIRMVSSGAIRLEPLMTKHFAFQDYAQAYRYIDENRETTMKVFIDVAE